MPQPSDGSRDAALKAVGRTILNFQRLEQQLKLAARLGSTQGTLQSIQRDSAKRQERAETLTLGQAIQAWLTYLDGTQAQVPWTPDLFDVSLQTTFTLEPAESDSAHARTLASLLAARNDLIHSRLAKVQWESPAACDTLVLELDAVNAAISEQLDYVTSLVSEIQKVHKAHAESLVANLLGAAPVVRDGDA